MLKLLLPFPTIHAEDVGNAIKGAVGKHKEGVKERRDLKAD